eukprot:gene13945-15401_t
MVTKQFQKRFCCLVLLLASWKQIRNGDCQLTTGGTFFERFDETLFGESESNNDAETVSTVEHHYCAINDQCEFVVDQENADSTMKQTSISDKKDLKSIESNAVIWKKKTKNGNNYQLKLNYSGGDIGDSMGPNNEMFFSTSDKDNDQDGTVNMASFAMGAWWYGPNGYFSNLNNMYTSPNVINQPLLYAMSWRTWGNKYGGLSFSEMKLRREA